MLKRILFSASLISMLTSCSFNPFTTDNETTGNPAAAMIGAGVGGGTAALLKSNGTIIGLSAIAGGAIGYYVTTLRYDASGVMMGGGQVYKVGDYVGIYMPSDVLFEPNTDEFRDAAYTILSSAYDILQRYPNHNILISGNTSGFYRPHWEKRLSERRAEKVASYFWNRGMSQYRENDKMVTRKLQYTGYGDYFPISNTLTNKGLRQNSRIQITAYPTDADLQIDKCSMAFHNMGDVNHDELNAASGDPSCGKPRCGFKGEC